METKVLIAGAPIKVPTFAEFLAEKQNSRRVPSPGKSSVADLTWPSLYGNSLAVGDYNKEAFLGQYIHRIYCRECREQERMAAANQSNLLGQQASGSDPDSPQYQMDQMSLAAAMDTNKEGRTLFHTMFYNFFL